VTPRVTRSKAEAGKEYAGFPVEHYSYSSMALFSSNPFMFKVRYVNGDSIDTTIGSTGVLGSALHKAIEVYLGGGEAATSTDEAEALKAGYEAGRQYLEGFSDGLIDWKSTVPDRAKLNERYAFAYFAYIKELGYHPKKQETLLIEKKLKHRVEVNGRALPVPLVARADWVYRENGEIIIDDHKFVTKWSDSEKIEGAKLLQAAVAYFVVGAELGEMPSKMRFREMKVVENKEKGTAQVRTFTIEFRELPLLFDFFFRFYEDITNALLGNQVYVPNINALYDNEVSLLAYIHRLDVDEEKAKALKKAKVDNITDFLRRKIVRTKSLNQFEETIARKFISAKTLNYKTMTPEEKIRMKLAEHGINVDFDSKVVGPAVTLYRYEPSVGVKMTRIEAFVKDIELVTASKGVRILAPIPGTDLIGFEVPNKERTFVGNAPHAQNLRVAVGVDIQGQTQYVSLPEAPHILIAGSTGSGKSVLINSILGAIGGSADLWLMDPKQVELSGFKAERYEDTVAGIHGALKDLVDEMEDRFTSMKGIEKNWSGRRIVAVIDELADLIMTSREHSKKSKAVASIKRGAKKEEARVMARENAKAAMFGIKGRKVEIKEDELVDAMCSEDLLTRLAQKGRAAGIHLIIATQRPSVDVITGTIKANFPTRMALRTASPIDSEVILGAKGAEKLCGKGDMLLIRSDSSELVRLQGFLA